MATETPKAGPPRFSKPRGFEARVGESGTRTTGLKIVGAETEPRSLLAARSRAALLNVSLDDLLVEDRNKLRASTYPGPDCFEPYEVEDSARNLLSKARLQHAETCVGCRSLLSGAIPTANRISDFLEDVRDVEPAAEAFGVKRGFWLDVAAVFAAAVAISGTGYVLMRFVGPIAADPTLRSAVLSQMAGVLRPVPVVSAWVVSLGVLGSLMLFYRRELLEGSAGALVAGCALGVVGAMLGWQNLKSTAATLSASVTLRQVQLTDAVAAYVAPFPWTSSRPAFDVDKVPVQSSVSRIQLTAWQKKPDHLVFASKVDGLPGSMVADMKPTGGQLYWDVASKQKPLAKILFGTVKSVAGDQFVLVDHDQQAHTFKRPAGSSVTPGAELLVLVSGTDDAVVSVHPITRKASQGERTAGR
jgi:hypothetical protein